MIVKVNGKPYLGFTSVSHMDVSDQLCNQFTISTTARLAKASPLKRKDTIELYSDNIGIFSGTVEKISGASGEDDYTVTTSGRENTKIILKHDVPPNLTIKGPMSLSEFLKKTMDACDIVGIGVVDETNGSAKLGKKEVASADVGTKVWDFWLDISEKLGVLLVKDGNGNIVIRKEQPEKYTKKLVRLVGDIDNVNNMFRINFDFDDSNLIQNNVFISQGNFGVLRDNIIPPDPDTGELLADLFPNATTVPTKTLLAWRAEEQAEALKVRITKTEPNSERRRVLEKQLAEVDFNPPQPTTRVHTRGEASNSGVSDGSTSYAIADNPSDNDECERLSKWKTNRQKREGFNYSCSVFAKSIDGLPWRSGWLIYVIDEVAGIDQYLLIYSVEESTSISENGDITDVINLTLTIPDAYDIIEPDNELQPMELWNA